MREEKIILSLVGIIVLLAAVFVANIGYANDGINSEWNNKISSSEFDIVFNTDSNYLNEDIKITGPRTVSLNHIDLKKIGESKTFLIPIVNNGREVSAKVVANVFNTNTEYFNVTCDISKSILTPKADEAIIKLTVGLKKMPLYSEENTEIKVEVVAEPIY